MATDRFVPLRGSMRAPLPGAEPVGPSDPNERITVTVYVRPSPALRLLWEREDEAARLPGAHGSPRGPELEAQFDADPADLSAVAEWGHGYGLSVVKQDLATRTLQLAGTAGAFSQAFGIELQTWQYLGSEYRDRIGILHVPESLADVVTAVLGLDNRPVRRLLR